MPQRAYRFRFYPTAAQQQMLNRCFGHTRWVWNYALARRRKAWLRRRENVSGVDISRELTRLKKLEPFAWLAEIPATVITQKLRDQDTAFGNWFADRAKKPRFRKRRAGGRRAVRFQLDQRRIEAMWDPAQRLLALPRLGPLKLRWSRLPTGVPKMVTVSRDACGRWFVSLAVEEAIEPIAAPRHEAVGIDVGLRDLVVPSHGESIPNPKHLKCRLRQLRHAQRSLSRKHKGSGRWHSQCRRVARLQCRVADARRDVLQTVTTHLVRESQAIGIEDLAVSNLLRNRRLARAIGDAGWGELRRQLSYKADWYGRDLVVADRWYPSSKTCSACGHRLKTLPLDVRHWTCPECGAGHDRDVNAAINLERAARAAVLARGGSLIPPHHGINVMAHRRLSENRESLGLSGR